MPQRLDVVRFVVGDREIDISWDLAVEIRDRCERADDAAARGVATRLRAVGATRSVTLSRDQLAALLAVLDQWEAEAEAGRRLREALAEELG